MKIEKYLGNFLALLFVSVALGFSIPEQQNEIFERIIAKLASYASIKAPEKVYVHTDKEVYTNGETIWLKTYLVDGILHKPSDKSEVVYVELFDPNDSLVVQQKLLVKDLAANAEITLPYNLKSGDYLLRAYTKYMLSDKHPIYFQKEIPIFEQSTPEGKKQGYENQFYGEHDFDEKKILNDTEFLTQSVKFFPEGGDLVEGLTSIMGLKITDSKGMGQELEGAIIDDKGNKVAFFKSHATGLGKVTFKPEPGKKYYALVNVEGEEKRFLIPKAKSSGHVMSIKNNGDHMILNLATNQPEGLAGTFLVGHFRGDTFFKRLGTVEDGQAYVVKLKTDRLLDGVAHFTLFTENGEPVCERLVFVDHPNNDVELRVKSDANHYDTREMVTVEVDAIDMNETMLKGDFSMSVVTKSNRLPGKMSRLDIKSWLLLDSDLGGTVEDPGYFFEDSSNERKYLLDALMLTHGWRRFVWKDMLGKKVDKEMAYAPEKAGGTVISGFTASQRNPKIAKQMTVVLRIPQLGIDETKRTDSYGRFSFGPFDLEKGEKTFLEIVSPDNRRDETKDVAIYLDKAWPELQVNRFEKTKYKIPESTVPNENPADASRTKDENADQDLTAYLKKAYTQKINDFEYDPSVTRLKEVKVGAEREDELKKIEAGSLHGLAKVRVFTDSSATAGTFSAIDLIGRSAGVQVSGTFPDQRIRMTTMKGHGTREDILFLVNGIQTDFLYIQNMGASEVFSIEVLRGIEAAVYGMRAAGGAILITTKRNVRPRKEIDNDAPEQIIPSFYKARQFFSPNYAIEGFNQNGTDYRTTLYWNPNILIEDNNSPPLQFFTGDDTGDFLIKVEGMTRDGRAVVGYSEFSVQ